jgi:hypothetical protein
MKTLKRCALTLGIALAMATVARTTTTWASFVAEHALAAPFSPNATIYRPDCSIKEDGGLYCGTDI